MRRDARPPLPAGLRTFPATLDRRGKDGVKIILTEALQGKLVAAQLMCLAYRRAASRRASAPAGPKKCPTLPRRRFFCPRVHQSELEFGYETISHERLAGAFEANAIRGIARGGREISRARG